jgi:LysR family glycine cleavage system transcriptional activator
MRRLPPLNALRAFEASARHLSFTRAAEELHVTQAAVSHQIRGLEDYLGLKLFKRGGRTLRLTEAGQAYLPDLRKAFELLRDATERLLDEESRGVLTVTMLPSLATRWLVPRLGLFSACHPEIDIRVAPSVHRVDFLREEVDMGIRYGRGDYPGLRCDRLMSEDIFPVCSPRLLEGPHALQCPDDLLHHTLLHDEGHTDWRNWLMAAGVASVRWDRGPIFLDSSMLLQAAVTGQGVALARGVLARGDLKAGRLVRPFRLNLPTEYAYYVVCPEETADRPRIAAFRAWLLEQARLDEVTDRTGLLPEPSFPDPGPSTGTEALQ